MPFYIIPQKSRFVNPKVFEKEVWGKNFFKKFFPHKTIFYSKYCII